MSVSDQLSRLEAEIDDLCAVDPGVLADGDTIIFLHRQFERIDAALTRATARFDADDGYVSSRALSAAAWMSSTCRVPLSTAQRRVRLGRGLRHMPVTEATWLAGDINSAHVSALERARTPVTAEAFAGAEEMLVDKAQDLYYRAFARALCYWGQLADPEGAEKSAEELAESRRVHLSQTFADTWRLDGLLDPIGGSMRLFTGATRRAIQVRDGECFHPFCQTPADQCQIDHIEPYGQGGLTTEVNGRAACAAHNRQRHRRHRRT